jgi:ribonuclease BN (tRNA processing enzyme)
MGMEIRFLGTNGWFDTPSANTACVLVREGNDAIVLDAGGGIFRLDQFLTGSERISLFLSHLHLDHIWGLHILNKFRFEHGIDLYGQTGTKEALSKILVSPFTIPLESLSFPLRLHDLEPGTHDLGYEVTCLPLVHAAPCFGYRFRLGGKTLVYCTDTGYCENAVRLAKDADLLITESAFLPGMQAEDWPHLNPETAIRIARESGAKRLALFHFDAALYPSDRERQMVEEQFSDTFPGLIVSRDGTRLTV